MFGLGLGGLGIGAGWRGDGGGVASPIVSAIFFGQSEVAYLLLTDSGYRTLPQPVPGNGNMIVITQSGTGAAPVRTVVNSATVASGLVNPAMTALSAFLARVVPGKTFVIGDGAVPGTSRFDLMDESTDGTDLRVWSDLTSVVTAVEAETGQPVGHLIECWYNADAAHISTFKTNFWPHYFGLNSDGSSFTMGGTVQGRPVNHCLWDGTAAATAKGRGIFGRSATLWHVLTPMPFHNAPTGTEMGSFSENNARLTEPARATMIGLASETMAQSVGLRVGPSAHLCKFGGASSLIHPDTGSKDGQIGLMWPFAFALMRAAGMTVAEPTIVGIEGPEDGSYADLLVSLPNGGTLTTLSALESRAAYAGSAPHQQPVTGIEITRSGTRHPVYQTAQTGYDVAFRGTVVIQSAAETHATYGRVGRVRVTPTTPFAFGNSLSYLRGQATASLLEPRDFELYQYFLLEHVPAWHDASALYPCPGVAVRPLQEEIQTLVPAPAFVARSAYFDGASNLRNIALSVAGGSKGMASFWFRQPATWTASQTVFEARVGGTAVLSAGASSSGRVSFRLNQDGTASDVFTTAANTFVGGNWYHVLWAWDYANARFQLYVNGVALNTASYLFTGGTKFDLDGATITGVGVGSGSSGASIWTGDIGHLYVNLTETLNLSVQANREKFALSGHPVNLGANGQMPTGSVPQFYCDGDGAAWNNLGTAGALSVTGALTAGAAP